MTDFPLMHPVTRLGRVVTQLRSFSELHAAELAGLADELEAAGAMDAAAKIRAFSQVQTDDGRTVDAELADIREDLIAQAETHAPVEVATTPPGDPAANSPKRAAWLAAEAAEAERRRQPMSRRDFFHRDQPE